MPQLKTHIAVSALMRRAQSGGAFSAIIRKGDMSAGAYLVVTRQASKHIGAGKDIYIIYRPIRNMEGERIWWPKGPLVQAELDIYINRRIDDDPDLWVVEIEDTQGRHFLVEPVEDAVSASEPIKDSDSDASSSEAPPSDEALKAAIKAVFPDQ